MNRHSIIKLLVLPFILFNYALIGQQTAVYDDPAAAYNSGRNLFEREQYGAAAEAFSEVIRASSDKDDIMQVNAQYYAAVCAMEMEHEDAEYRLTEFIGSHPENTLSKKAYFQLGKIQFSNGKYSKTLESFKQVEVPDLDKEEKTEFFYKKS